MSKDTGGPAFGQVVELRCVRVEMDGATEWEPEAMLHGGLTVRDYFASKAMQAMNCNPAWDDFTLERVAKDAYLQADLMIAERSKP